jgi:hypothetical protein
MSSAGCAAHASLSRYNSPLQIEMAIWSTFFNLSGSGVVSKFFLVPCYREKIKYWLVSMKTLPNCENSSSNPLQTACCGIQAAACDSVNCSVSQR